jgi:hemolysin III
VTNAPPTVRRPIFRGWSHALAIGPALVGTALLVASARGDPIKQLSLLLYGATLVSLFSVSTVYHRHTWSLERRARFRRLDTATIFVMIAGTYTPIVVTVLSGLTRVAMFSAIWILAISGVVLVVCRIPVRHGILTGLYLALGWVSLIIMPQVVQRVGWGGVATLAAGGVFYSLGAAAYALKRPRLWPAVFSYHEVFHLLVIAASACFFLFMVQHVVPLQ